MRIIFSPKFSFSVVKRLCNEVKNIALLISMSRIIQNMAIKALHIYSVT